MGTPIFHRHHRTVGLTVKGHRFADDAATDGRLIAELVAPRRDVPKISNKTHFITPCIFHAAQPGNAGGSSLNFRPMTDGHRLENERATK